MMLDTNFFPNRVPARPIGRYAHIIMLRVTEGYALFQTDGELNKARVAAGRQNTMPVTRITLFKRKQTTPERLNGRALLRNVGMLSTSEDEKDEFSCIYNVKSCKRCPDCITYGFAIGEGGSEKSKVYADTAFSLTDYVSSHEVFTLSAPYEAGTTSQRGEFSPRMNQQDHVKPQTIFPAVLTTRDLTPNLFAYVLHNVLRTTRYGASTTRGGTMRNHIVAIALNDGEIFSNLLFTQNLYDALGLTAAQHDPVDVQQALNAANRLIPELLEQDSVRNQQLLMNNSLQTFIDNMRHMNDESLRSMLEQASSDARAYYDANIAKTDRKK